MPPVRRRSHPHVRRPGNVSALRELRRRGALDEPEVFYPLHVRLCGSCLLVQLPAYVSGEDIFSDYAYFSSYSDSWVAHAKRYAEAMIERLGLTRDSLVTEVASNDGYLLQHFVAQGIPVLGVEPAENVAEAARSRGIPTVVEFLGPETGREIAERHGRADLVAANNVFAHVPDIRGFAAGLRALVKDTGLVTLEFPHLLRLIERRQYDTIYHEHYLVSLPADLLPGPGHGRAARGRRRRARAPMAARCASTPAPRRAHGEPTTRVKAVLDEEESAGLHTVAGHAGFAGEVLKIKSDLLGFLLTAAREGRSVAGYGAPGKGNTLLNHCGIRADLLCSTRSTGARSSRGSSCRARISRSMRPNVWPRPGPTTSSSCHGTSGTRSAEQLDYVRSWGGAPGLSRSRSSRSSEWRCES